MRKRSWLSGAAFIIVYLTLPVLSFAQIAQKAISGKVVAATDQAAVPRSEEHTTELQSPI